MAAGIWAPLTERRHNSRMSEPYEEILDSRTFTRPPPGARHEQICARLHQLVRASVADSKTTCLLAPRTEVRLSITSQVRPDLALVTSATNKLWLAAEMQWRDNRYRAVIPGDYTQSVYLLQYYFELHEGPAGAWLYPGFEPTLSNQPYFVVRRG